MEITINYYGQGFVSELEQVPFSDSGGLFDQFVAVLYVLANFAFVAGVTRRRVYAFFDKL